MPRKTAPAGARSPSTKWTISSADRVEHGDDGDRGERRVRAVAAGRLAVAPDPVAGERQHERRQPELAERRRVDEEAGEEAADRADDGAAQERDGDERHEHEIRHAAEHVHLREDRDLKDRRDEEQCRGLEAVDARHRFFVETSAATASSESKLANGWTFTVRKVAMSLVPTLSTRPIGMPYG